MFTWFAVLIVYVESISSIMLRPYPVATVRYGRQLHLECETNNNWISLSWRKNAQTYVFVFNQNNCNTITNSDFLKATCGKRENITFSSLIDVNPKRNDTWECLAVFPGNEIRQNRTKVDISGPYVELSNQTDVLYGDPAELNCTMDPKWSRCTWKKSDNDNEILSVTSCTNKTTSNYYLLCTGNNIILHVKFPVHLSSYECIGFYYTDNGLISPIEETTVVIYAEPPSLQISSKPLNPVEHYDFELQCIATGRPMPTTSWIITSDSEIEQGSGKSKIQFHNLKRTDSIEITCRATSSYLNKIMKAEIKYNMTVLYPPEARIIGKMVNQSDNIQLKCLVEIGQPAKYNVTGWEHRVEGILIRTINITDNHLNFTKISIFDTGQYSCFVSNGIKDGDGDILIKGTGNLSVHGSPYIVAGLKLYEVRIGEDAKIEVTVLSFPPLEHARLSKRGSTERIDMNLQSLMSYISFYGVDVLLSVQNATYSFSVTTERIGQYTIELENGYFTENFYTEIKSDSSNSAGEYQEKKTDMTVTIVASVIGVVVFLSIMVVAVFCYRRRKSQSKKTEKGNLYEQTEKRYVMLDEVRVNNEGTYDTPIKTDAETDFERNYTISRNKENTDHSSCPKKCKQQTKASSGYVEVINHYEEIGAENTENGNRYETIKDPSKKIQRKQTDLVESNDGNADVKTKENISRKPDLPPRGDKNKVSEEETFSNTDSNITNSSSDADHDRKENPDNENSSDFNATSLDNPKERTKRPKHDVFTALENPDNEKSSDFYTSSLDTSNSKEKTKGAKHELSTVLENPENEKSSDFYSSSLDNPKEKKKRQKHKVFTIPENPENEKSSDFYSSSLDNLKEKAKGANHELSTVSENPDSEKSSDFCSTSLDHSKEKTKGEIHKLSTVSENTDNEKSSDFCSTSPDNTKEKTKGQIHDASAVSDDSNSAKASGISVLIDSIGFEKRASPKTENFNTQDAKRSSESNNCQERSESISSDKITQL